MKALKLRAMYSRHFSRFLNHYTMTMRSLYSALRARLVKTQPNWVDTIRTQQSAELEQLFAERVPYLNLQDKKNILIYSMIPWPQGCVEHMLSIALRLRGHEVISVICGGILPDCELHYFDFDRPPCHLCRRGALGYTDAFGIKPLLSADFLDQRDVNEAHELLSSLSESELAALEYHGVPVGLIARFHVNIFYQTFLITLDEIQTEQFRTFCEVALLLAKFSERLLTSIQPDVVLVSNGKAFTYRPMFLLARSRNIHVVTWEEHAFDNEMKFVFNHNCYAGEIHLEHVWQTEKTKELTDSQMRNVDEYFVKWRESEITPFPYYKNTMTGSEDVYTSLCIPSVCPIIACFPNMVRDTSAFDRDVAFGSLIDWILKTVAFATTRSDLHFVIRGHPAEKCLPEDLGKYNKFIVCDEVRRTFPNLPENVHLLEGDSHIDSYSLMERAAVVIVYTSTIGLECALQGKLACVVGDVHYRNKGFTKDITQADELWRFLNDGPPYTTDLSPTQVELAKRYAFLWRFRHPFVMPFYDPGTRSFRYPDLAALAPDGNSVIDQLCRCIVTGSPFINIDAEKAIQASIRYDEYDSSTD